MVTLEYGKLMPRKESKLKQQMKPNEVVCMEWMILFVITHPSWIGRANIEVFLKEEITNMIIVKG